MTTLLIQGEVILAVGRFVDDGENIRAYVNGTADAVYPKHVIDGFQIVDAELPEDFTCTSYLWQGAPVKKPSPAPTSDDRSAKLTLVNAECDKRMSALVAGYPEREQQTFDKQEKEARAFTADAAATTPLLDALSANRGVSKADLASRIITKADAFAAYAGKIIGYRQKLEDQINAAADVAALSSIDAANGWPA